MTVDRELATEAEPVKVHGGRNSSVPHVCPVKEIVSEWLDRQRLLGLITAEGAAAVERLIEDLR